MQWGMEDYPFSFYWKESSLFLDFCVHHIKRYASSVWLKRCKASKPSEEVTKNTLKNRWMIWSLCTLVPETLQQQHLHVQIENGLEKHRIFVILEFVFYFIFILASIKINLVVERLLIFNKIHCSLFVHENMQICMIYLINSQPQVLYVCPRSGVRCKAYNIWW